MTKRKLYILDKGFQLRTTFSVLAVVAVVSLIIISMISANVVYNNGKIVNIYEIENNIFTIMQTTALSDDKAASKRELTDRLLERHNANLSNMQKIVSSNRYLLAGLVVFIIVQFLLLYTVVVRTTHRISGPIHVISNHIREILSGKDPVIRPLRTKDELKGFYGLFSDLAEYIRKIKK